MRTIVRLPLSVALAALALAGCGGPTSHSSRAEYGWGVNRFEFADGSFGAQGSWQPAEPAPPSLALDDVQVADAMAAQAARRQARERQAAARPEPLADVESAARDVSALYGLAQRDRADALVREHPGLLDLDEARASGELSVACAFVHTGRGGVLELTLARADSRGAVAVCVPPGTYGVPVCGDVVDAIETDDFGSSGGEWVEPREDRRYRHWPSPQDLALLQARVVVLPAGETTAQVTFPVACAAFDKRGPSHGQAYQLERLPRGSQVDRLLVALCAGEVEANEAEVQLAVWLSRNDISWEQFKAEGGHWGRLATFGRGQSVLPEHAVGAARILLDSGVDPRGMAFFGGRADVVAGEGGDAEAPLAPPSEEPAAAPEEAAPEEPAPTPPSDDERTDDELQG